MSFVSYAQNFEDVMLYRALKFIPKGFYVDVGAQDAVNHSVTKAFYDQGWQGINIEPVPSYAEQLLKQRPRDINLAFAVTENMPSYPSDLYFVEDTGLSTLDPGLGQKYLNEGRRVTKIKVSPITLKEVFRQYVKQEVHFLKIDVEGAEETVLRGMDFVQYRPWIVVIEATYPQTNRLIHEKWEHLLLNAKYESVYFDGLNRFYLASEKMELKKYFSCPPNVFDDFVLVCGHDFAKLTVEYATQVQKNSSERLIQIETLTKQLREIEIEANAYFKQIKLLTTTQVVPLEQENKSFMEQIAMLTKQLKASEEDRRLRFEQIQILTKQLKEMQTRASSHPV